MCFLVRYRKVIFEILPTRDVAKMSQMNEVAFLGRYMVTLVVALNRKNSFTATNVRAFSMPSSPSGWASSMSVIKPGTDERVGGSW